MEPLNHTVGSKMEMYGSQSGENGQRKKEPVIMQSQEEKLVCCFIDERENENVFEPSYNMNKPVLQECRWF